MCARKVLSLIIVAVLLNMVLAPASAQPAPLAPMEDDGIIAYQVCSTHEIRIMTPDGSFDKHLWSPPPASPGLYGALDMAWRPDGRELAFSGDHEAACSWFQSDIFAIGAYGIGYRRITNAPNCAMLAYLPKGSVTVEVNNQTNELVQAYVAGAPEPKSILAYNVGVLTFNNVADLGTNVPQPPIGILGNYRFMSSPPFADVRPNTTQPGGHINYSEDSGVDAFGTGKISWKADGSSLAYSMRSGYAGRDIAAYPSYGSIGEDLQLAEDATASLVAWGPTPDTEDLYLYYSHDSLFNEDVGGIFVNEAGDTSGGTQLISISNSNGEAVLDLEWLPDGSGFLFSARYVNLGIYADIFEYNFETPGITKLTPNLLEEGADGRAHAFSISPDGQWIVFERVVFPLESPSDLWVIHRNGTGLEMLLEDAGRPAWGPMPPPANFVVLPFVVRGR